MKKTGIIVAALLALTMLLTACDGNVMKNETSSGSAPVAASVKTGLATVNSMAIADDALTAKTVAAAVTVGDGGKITACRLDEVETDAKLKEGRILKEKDVRSKYEQGDDFGLSAASPISKEWYEQVDALCDYVVGKTAAEVADIPLDDGVATEENLRSRCALTITTFLEAIGKACDMATERGAQAGDTLSLAITVTDGAVGSDARVQTDVQVAAMTVNSRGVATDCLVDVASKKVEVVDGAFFGDTGTFRSKKDKKTGMDDTSDTETDGEWATSAKAFEEYVTGKTAEQIKETPLTDGKPAADTDLAKKCTIRVAEMLRNVLKAMNADTGTTVTVQKAEETATGNILDDIGSMVDDAVSMAEDAVSKAEDMLTESR